MSSKPGLSGSFLLVLGLWALTTAMPGCGSQGGGPEPSFDGLSQTDLAEANSLFQRLANNHSLQQDTEAVATAEVLVTLYPAYERNDEALVLAIDSADRLGQAGKALTFTDQLVEGHPSSSQVNTALARGATIAAAAGDSLRGADYLVTLYERDPAGQTGDEGEPLAARYL